MRTRVRWLAAVAAGALAAAAALNMGPANAESNGGVRVMPLGDSITYGWGDGNPDPNPGGYRIGLWQRLVAGGYRADFVGSQSNGPAGLGDHDHEGHPGWRIDQIDANIVGWLNTYQPHTVLLHIGTNDIGQNYDVAHAPNRLSALIDHITTTAPSAEVFVAQIIPYGFPSTALDNFNAAIPGIVQSKVAAGKHVHLVDMYHALTAADLSTDRVHPNPTGYDKMAATWYQALLSVPGSVGSPGGTPSSAPPSSVPPGTGGPVRALGAGKCLDVPGGSQANNTRLQIWECTGVAHQRFTYTPGKQLMVYGNKCLDASGHGRGDGTAVIIWDCGGGTNQQWNLNTNGTITGVESGLCLDVTGGSTTNGALVQLWTCNGNSQQQWRFDSAAPTTPPTTPPPTGPGGGSCGVNPVDPDATTPARNLLCYLYSQYGNHILSGQQESTWVNGPDYEMNYIHGISGKYPAIRGQDMGDSPDFGARGLAWWNAGGIPMVSYHMGSPSQDTDGYAGSQLTANINAALSSGTADNNRLNTRLTNWAIQLKIIQNGGGAVILRPWHEASGTWFWWSKEGAGQYNRLWIYTYNFMRNAGVHNLVYLHPFNGSPSMAWYPGKQYVDIGGADAYVGDHGPLTSMYNSARNVYGSSMPIALHENGPIPDPGQLQSTGTRWVLFNTWHTTWITNTSTNPPSTINSVYNSSYVVTRDEVPNLR